MTNELDLSRIMPDAWRVFFRFRIPRPVQAEAIPHIIKGTSTLISSPTASGKTEAAFAPLYQRHVTFRRAQLSVVYVAPTKALVNDMYSRLTEYFINSGEIIQRYTGDHHDFTDAHGKFALLCTPEALDSLQLVHNELLNGIRAIVCDELHLLHGTSRGQQLRSVIARICQNSNRPSDERDTFQIVAMTATMQDQEGVAQLWLGDGATIVNVGEPRPIHIQYLTSHSDDVAITIHQALRTTPHDKLLIFANTRNQAHEIAARLNDLLPQSGWPVYLHIGILARTERERIEYAMKHERRGVCVATSTLEVGIDIGDIDVVVLCQPPRSVSSFLQRLGRGNRRSGNCVLWAIASSIADRQVYAALLSCGTAGILDDVHEYHRYSVDVQQLLSLSWIGVKLHDPLTRLNVAERSGSSVSEEALTDMLSTGILKDVRGALVPNDAWMDVADSRQIHSVILGASGVPIFDAQSGETVGVADHQVMDGLFFAGTRMRAATAQDGSGVYVQSPLIASTGRKLAKLPTSFGGRRGRSRQLVWALAAEDGIDPRSWVWNGSTLTTFGGADYNLLLATILNETHPPGSSEFNDYSILGVTAKSGFGPEDALELAERYFASKQIPANVAVKFREANSFTKQLSRELQRAEAYASVPIAGFTRWLRECCSIRVHSRNSAPNFNQSN